LGKAHYQLHRAMRSTNALKREHLQPPDIPRTKMPSILQPNTNQMIQLNS